MATRKRRRRKRSLGQLPELVGLGRRRRAKRHCVRFKMTSAGKRCAKYATGARRKKR